MTGDRTSKFSMTFKQQNSLPRSGLSAQPGVASEASAPWDSQNLAHQPWKGCIRFENAEMSVGVVVVEPFQGSRGMGDL
jgi:hypothetical protein